MGIRQARLAFYGMMTFPGIRDFNKTCIVLILMYCLLILYAQFLNNFWLNFNKTLVEPSISRVDVHIFRMLFRVANVHHSHVILTIWNTHILSQ